MRLIDADDLLANLGTRYCTEADINAQPTIDAVSVVRCCECKYHSHDGGTGCCRWWRRWSNMDEYCAHGEVADK